MRTMMRRATPKTVVRLVETEFEECNEPKLVELSALDCLVICWVECAMQKG